MKRLLNNIVTFNKTVRTIMESKKEPFDWVLYIKFNTTGGFDRGVYTLVPYKDITPRMEAIIEKGKMEEKTKKYKLYTYNKGPFYYFVRLGIREELVKTLEWYKGMYGDNLKSLAPVLKPKTKKHFGDILASLNDSFYQTEGSSQRKLININE